MDGMHDERGLHRHGRAVARIHPLHLARDQAVAHIIESGPAIFRGNGRAEQAKLAHLGHDPAIEILFQIGLRHARRSEEHTSELQSLMRISYAVFSLKKTKKTSNTAPFSYS